MRTLASVAALGLVGLFLTGCAYRAPVMPPQGAIYTGISAPLTVDVEGQTVSPKKGEASSSAILGLFAWGDCSLQKAAQEGQLSTIEYCDYSYMSIVFGIYQSFTVTAHGK